jgi:hypothetical protein
MQTISNLLTYTQKLKDAGASEALATAHTEMLATLIENDLVTKQDLASTKQDLMHEIGKLENRMDNVEAKLEAKIDGESARLDARIDALDTKFTGKFNLLYWMTGFLLAGVGTLLFKAM